MIFRKIDDIFRVSDFEKSIGFPHQNWAEKVEKNENFKNSVWEVLCNHIKVIWTKYELLSRFFVFS